MSMNPHLYMSVNQPIQLKVVVVFSKRVDQGLSNLEPADKESELKGEEERIPGNRLSSNWNWSLSPKVELGPLGPDTGLVELPVGLAGLGHHPLRSDERWSEVHFEKYHNKIGKKEKHIL